MRFAVIGLVFVLGACASSSGDDIRVMELRPQNDSGVTGSVTLTASGADRTIVEVDADPAGHPDMPSHIHAGTCDQMIPQPMFPLENVRDGEARTEIPISLTELLAGTVVLNVHHSNDHMEMSTACVELGPGG